MNKAKTKPTVALNSRGNVTRSPKQGYQCPLNRTRVCVRQSFLLHRKKRENNKDETLVGGCYEGESLAFIQVNEDLGLVAQCVRGGKLLLSTFQI